MADNNTQQFLPEGTNAVLRNKKTGASQWYTTKKELVFDNSEPGFTQCPKTNQRVRFVSQGNYDLLFPQNLIRSRIVVSDVPQVDEDVLSKISPVVFGYYIPTGAYPNPSHILRRFAFRIDGSGWVMDEGDVPYNLIAEMLDAGCRVYSLKFDSSELKKLSRMAVESLQIEVNNGLKETTDSIGRAEAQLNGAEQEGITADEAADRYLKRAEGVAKRLDKLKDDLTEAAKRFGISTQAMRIEKAVTASEAIRTNMEARAFAYREAAKKAAELGTAGQAIAEAIKQDAIPAEIVADFLEDHEDGAGDALRAAFTAPTDADTFDLDSGDDEVTPAA